MGIAKKKLVKALLKKGFVEEESKHHLRFRYRSLGNILTEVRTYVSHTPKMNELDKHLEGQISRQCRMSRKELTEFVRCSIDQEQYEQILVREGEL